MNILSGEFVYCYGINRLDFKLDFTQCEDATGKTKAKAYAIYAPNGLMKSSFAKTFLKISKDGKGPDEEERYHRKSTCKIIVDEKPIKKEMIYVLDSKVEINSDTNSDIVTNILVDPQSKGRYDNLIIDLEKKKNDLIKNLNQLSGVKKDDIEKFILEDLNGENFAECIELNSSLTLGKDYSHFKYADIFNKDTENIISNPDFLENSKKFTDRYHELFENEGSIFKKGVFNPSKAEASLVSLTNNGFFKADHQVMLKGDNTAISGAAFKSRYDSCIKKIESDETLKSMRSSLEKNANTKALFKYMEELDNTLVAFFLDSLSPENQREFKRNLWIYYLLNSAHTKVYLQTYNDTKDEIRNIEIDAAKLSGQWTAAVDLFNDRFVDMPCTLDILNRPKAVLGREKAVLLFKFEDAGSETVMLQKDLKTLSAGEMRALYLLNMIFEAEYRKSHQIETLFIFDDIVDSFDYKNKAAILLYLDDLAKIDCFYQIILTHNFDFYRALAQSFVHRTRCLTSVLNETDRSIKFEEAEGINNCFTGILKNQINNSDKAFCATIPFTRNIIEYTKDNFDLDGDYLTLTSLLHWKKNSETITIQDYLDIYKKVFNKTIARSNGSLPVMDLLFSEADNICINIARKGFNLTDKILLCMAIRIKAERFMIDKLQEKDPGYWCDEVSQYGHLLPAVKNLDLSFNEIRLLDQVRITVSSNIHLNSFMYEPIVDLSLESLIDLYRKVNDLVNSV